MAKLHVSRTPEARGIAQLKYPLSPAESYIVGVLLGDGYVNRYSGGRDRTGLHCKNEAFAREFYNALLKLRDDRKYLQHIRQYRKGPCFRSYNGEFYVEWYGKRICDFMDYLKERLSQNLEKLGKKRLFAFVKGFYDSEGTCLIDKGRWHYRITFYNTNLAHIKLIGAALLYLGFHPRLNLHTQDSSVIYMLRISGRHTLQRFFQWSQPVPNKRPKASSLPPYNRLGQERYNLNFLGEKASEIPHHPPLTNIPPCANVLLRAMA